MLVVPFCYSRLLSLLHWNQFVNQVQLKYDQITLGDHNSHHHKNVVGHRRSQGESIAN